VTGAGVAKPAGPRVWTLERTQFIARPRDEVFAFFADPRNLERITPAPLRFRIVSPPPIEVRSGTLIDYRLRLHGVPFRWRTRIERVDPPHAFVDTQLVGPYRRWEHLHEFTEVDGGTEMRDRVEYTLPFGPLGHLARLLLVRGALEGIFDFRRDAVRELLSERGTTPARHRGPRHPEEAGAPPEQLLFEGGIAGAPGSPEAASLAASLRRWWPRRYTARVARDR